LSDHRFSLPFDELPPLYARTADFRDLAMSSTAFDHYLDCLPACRPGRPIDEADVPLWQKACTFLREIWVSCLGNSVNSSSALEPDWNVRVVLRPPAF
jgi:hypothetical protein